MCSHTPPSCNHVQTIVDVSRWSSPPSSSCLAPFFSIIGTIANTSEGTNKQTKTRTQLLLVVEKEKEVSSQTSRVHKARKHTHMGNRFFINQHTKRCQKTEVLDQDARFMLRSMHFMVWDSYTLANNKSCWRKHMFSSHTLVVSERLRVVRESAFQQSRVRSTKRTQSRS